MKLARYTQANIGLIRALSLNSFARGSLDSTIARVNNRLAYGLILDVFDLASAYAAAISQRHCFLDANKRTAFQSMDVILDLNGVRIDWCIEEVGDRVIDLAQCRLDEAQFASWLRTLVD